MKPENEKKLQADLKNMAVPEGGNVSLCADAVCFIA